MLGLAVGHFGSLYSHCNTVLVPVKTLTIINEMKTQKASLMC